MKRATALATVFLLNLCGLSTQAQYVFIPDPAMRDWLNLNIQGVVDGDGYMDTTHAGIAGYADGTIINSNSTGPTDMTGLQYLHGLTKLTIIATTGTIGAAFPPNLSILSLNILGPVSIPSLPVNLDHLELSAGIALDMPELPADLESLIATGAWTGEAWATLPPQLRTLNLTSMPYVSALPTLPQSLWTLHLEDLPLSSVAVLPPEIRSVTLKDLDDVTGLPDLPASLDSLRILAVPGISSIPLLPEALVQFHCLNYSALPGLPPLPNDLHDLALSGMAGSAICPPLPEALNKLQLEWMSFASLPDLPPTLSTLFLSELWYVHEVPSLPFGLRTLFLRGLSELTAVPALPAGLEGLYLSDCPLLSGVPPLPTTLLYFSIQECPDIPCLPTIPTTLVQLYIYSSPINCLPNELGQWTMTSIDFDPGNICTESCPYAGPLIGGRAYHDLNGNGMMDGDEYYLDNVLVSADPGNWLLATDQYGKYWASLPLSTYVLSAQAATAYPQTSVPAQHIVPLISITDLDTSLNFAMSFEEGHHDLRVDMVATDPRPGFQNNVWLTVTNVGTEPLAGEMIFHSAWTQEWVSTTPTPASIIGGIATWNLPQLHPGSTWTGLVVMHTHPDVPLGTLVTQTLEVIPTVVDETPSDDQQVLTLTVIGSFDPNDKRVTPTFLSMEQLVTGERLTYTIRFQNTGTAAAERVRIADLMDPMLQGGSLRFISSSHTCTWSVQNRLLTFDFLDINLPDSTSDEPGSHGYVQFDVLPLTSLSSGDIIPNSASIFFDYNEAIITNTVTVGIEAIESVQEPAIGPVTQLIFPNPARDRFMVRLPNPEDRVSRLELTNFYGAVIPLPQGQANASWYDINDVAPGHYVVRVLSEQGTWVSRIVIL